MEKFEFKGVEYDVSWKSEDTRHGGPFDRGSADSYYGRGINPHFYTGGTGTSDRIEEVDMTPEQVDAYYAGYQWNETVNREFKDWG